jgi:hypothetical protein
MADHWRHATPGADAMRGTGKDEAAYAAGWTVSGLATLEHFPLNLQHIQSCGSSWRIRWVGMR